MVLVDNGLLSSRWIRVNKMEKRKKCMIKAQVIYSIFSETYVLNFILHVLILSHG